MRLNKTDDGAGDKRGIGVLLAELRLNGKEAFDQR